MVVLIIFFVIFQTDINVIMLSVERQGVSPHQTQNIPLNGKQ